MDHLAEQSSKAISNIKFDKITVWDADKGDGSSSTGRFLRGLATSLPPVLHMMRDIAGVEMPEALGKLQQAVEEGENGEQRDQPPPPPPPGE